MNRLLDEPTWRNRAEVHEQRVDDAVADHIHRRDRGLKHPIDDFLFQYYSYKPSQLRVWHPGVGVDLAGADERAGWAFYRVSGGHACVDVDRFVERRGVLLQAARRVLRATLDRPMLLSCFGMHEWAMAYRTTPHEIRHAQLPLRLGHDGTDEVVESHDLRCTHFDAYRFFTPSAVPLNSTALQRDSQADFEQPGCLHAGMDLYKWAHKLSPAVPSDLVMDCFDLAREVRVLDMRASPYDVSSLGHQPVAVETPEGKAEYIRAQREFAERARPLRVRLLEVLDGLTR
ncbi:3-methyladenine DNA glycosylase [Calidifontibacter indicus]|uniref:3-methyladenine DNA glycosylase n=1 Tax=Calidifontibacter indicus TaxID=419650 RepID=UPI003D72F436